ncbi:MAG TPA: nucleotide sugar dehydrogenase [Gemmatimonadaceae bacterium]|nr:nucleotide sugar dehydrogenase [Gemmatimonadaceae bacterium]
MTFDRISVFGLGKLGACMAATMADRGAHVIGVDVSPTTVATLNAGHAPVVEPGLAELVAANRERLRATTDAREAVLGSDLSFIIVPTPSDSAGGFATHFVEQVARDIGRALRDKAGYHLVVLTSTVLPGATAHRVLPLLEAESGKACGPDFGLCYNPEFIALGSVVRDLLNPDVVLIGQSDERAGALLEAWYAGYCDNAPPVERMSFVNAELTKLAVNTYVTMKITFANTLAALCEELPGADVDVVSAAIGRDSRIGRKYLTGGLGYGGPCFPRDNKALFALAQTLGTPAGLARATDLANDALLERQLERIHALLQPGMSVAVLGVAYKPDTTVVEESQGLALARALAERGVAVTVHDALALDAARAALGDAVRYEPSLAACLQAADLVVLATPTAELRALEAADFPARERPVIVVDCWRLLATKLAGDARVEYVPLGVGQPLPAPAGAPVVAGSGR